MVKRKRDELMSLAKDNVKIGIMSGAGMAAVGAVGGMPGVPAGATGPAMAGLGLLPVGSLARTGMGLARMTGCMTERRKRRRY